MSKYFLFILILIASCDLPVTDSYYLLPTDILEIPSDGMNKITYPKVAYGDTLFHSPQLSMSTTVSCADCHDSENRFQTHDISIIGGCGEGCLIKDGEYKLIEGYFGKIDSMNWVVSHGATNIAYATRAGLSSRFFAKGNPDTTAIINHFGLDRTNQEFLDKLLSCKPSLFQCMVALGGHRQFSAVRLMTDNPQMVESLERIFNVDITPLTPANEIKFYIACCIDAYQRSKLTTDGRFQQYLRGEIQLDSTELKGFELSKEFCVDCHNNKVFGGQIAPSSFPNLSGVPDAVNDIMSVPDTNYVWRVVRPFMGQMILLAPHGEHDNMEDYLFEHVPFEMDHTNKRQLDTLEIKALAKFIETI